MLVPIDDNRNRVNSAAGNQFDNLQYDANFIDLHTYIKNLRSNRIELRERQFVDKPNRSTKQMNIENQYALSSTFNLQTRNSFLATEEDEQHFHFETEPSQPSNRKEDDFLFGQISASRYQDFKVVKINKRGRR